jgi:hypothetical protein
MQISPLLFFARAYFLHLPLWFNEHMLRECQLLSLPACRRPPACHRPAPNVRCCPPPPARRPTTSTQRATEHTMSSARRAPSTMWDALAQREKVFNGDYMRREKKEWKRRKERKVWLIACGPMWRKRQHWCPRLPPWALVAPAEIFSNAGCKTILWAQFLPLTPPKLVWGGWYVHNVYIISYGFMLILCCWHLFFYKVYDLFGLTY